MADIHGMGDINNSNNNNNYRNQDDNSAQYMDGQFTLLGSLSNTKGDPRSESFLYFITNFICPNFSLISFTSIILCLNILIFLISIIINFDPYATEFLSPSPAKFMLKTFSLSKSEILGESRTLNIYRYITNSLLHAHFLHLIFNTIIMLMFGSLVEKLIKTWKTAFVYILSGVLGSLFSLFFVTGSSVGASICVYGILGGYFMFCIINWKLLDRLFGPIGKSCMFYILLFYIVFMLIIQFSNKETSMTNVYGHLGGLLSGFFLTGCVVKPLVEGEETSCVNMKVIMYGCIGICGAFAVLGFTLFYALN